MLRTVIDTNTWVSGLIWSGAPRALIQRVVEGEMRGITSSTLAREFERVLHYPRIEKALVKRGLVATVLSTQFALLNDLVEAAPITQRVSRDPDDDAVLACALAAKADLIVSGDQDLLVLQAFEGIPIVTAAQALERLPNRR
jgi:uncharacterized protein